MERVLELRERDPQAYATLSVGTRAAAGQYEAAKQAAAEPEQRREQLADERARRRRFAGKLGWAADWTDADLREEEPRYARKFPEPLADGAAYEPLGDDSE